MARSSGPPRAYRFAAGARRGGVPGGERVIPILEVTRFTSRPPRPAARASSRSRTREARRSPTSYWQAGNHPDTVQFTELQQEWFNSAKQWIEYYAPLPDPRSRASHEDHAVSDPFDVVVSDALTTVGLVPRWKLERDDWDGVADALREMAAAVESGNAKLVRRASERLDGLYPPTRLSAIPRGTGGSSHQEPPPPDVMELVNTLVHPSGGWSSGAAPDSGSSL